MAASIESNVAVLTDEDVAEAVQIALSEAGCSLEELQTQAASGSFTTERLRRTWFAIAAFID